MMTDPIADMLTRIRNAVRVERPHVQMPISKVKRGLAEVLKRNDHLLVGSTVFRGEMRYPDPADYVPDVDDVLIHMQEEAEGSDCGEWVEDYPEPSDEAKAELKALLEPIKAWARLHCRPDFGLVENVQEHVLTQEDIDQAMETEA